MDSTEALTLVNFIGVVLLALHRLAVEIGRLWERRAAEEKKQEAIETLTGRVRELETQNETLSSKVSDQGLQCVDLSERLGQAIVISSSQQVQIDDLLEVNWHLVRGIDVLSEQLKVAGHTPDWIFPEHVRARIARYRTESVGEADAAGTVAERTSAAMGGGG